MLEIKLTPEQQRVRACIASCFCPICGKGPFKLLAGHTRHKHDIHAEDLRKMAKLTKFAPTCSEEFSEGKRDWCLRTGKAVRPSHGDLTKRRDMTEAGIEMNREKLRQFRHLRTHYSKQVMRAALLKAWQMRRTTTSALMVQAADLWSQGHTLEEISKRVPLCTRTISRHLKKRGLMGDGRSMDGGNRWRGQYPRRH